MSKLNWENDSTYFLTGSTFLHYPYFNVPEKKLILLNQIRKIKEKFNLAQLDYSIAINHYHLKFHLKNGNDLANIKKILHGGTSFLYKQKYDLKYKDIWQPPKTVKIFSDEVSWKVTGYIIGNLIKHKEVSKIDQLEENVFCSYKKFIQEYNKETAKDLIHRVINVYENADNWVDFKELENLKI
jgi:REP element-mobilizing transposase RayT